MAGGSLTRAARYFNRGERVLVKLRPPAAMRGVLAVTLAGCEETRTEWSSKTADAERLVNVGPPKRSRLTDDLETIALPPDVLLQQRRLV